jgi:hypothetical protein
MLRLIGVFFIAVIAQFAVYGWNQFVAASGEHAVQSWKNELDAIAEKASRE